MLTDANSYEELESVKIKKIKYLSCINLIQDIYKTTSIN